MTIRQISDVGLDLIISFERLRLVGYDDGYGIPTVGFGHTGKDVDIGMIITQDEARTLLRGDLSRAERAVCRLIKRPLTDNQFAALVSFTFNGGSGMLQRSTLRMKVNCYDDSAVPREFAKYVFSRGRKSRGLLNRRRAEIALYTAA